MGNIFWALEKKSPLFRMKYLIIFLTRNKFGQKILHVNSINSQNFKTVLNVKYQVDESSGHGLKIR